MGGGALCLEDVLSSVAEFRVRAEYGVGDDRCGLDNVRLVPASGRDGRAEPGRYARIDVPLPKRRREEGCPKWISA